MVSGLVTSPCDQLRIRSGDAREMRMLSKSVMLLPRSNGLERYKVSSVSCFVIPKALVSRRGIPLGPRMTEKLRCSTALTALRKIPNRHFGQCRNSSSSRERVPKILVAIGIPLFALSRKAGEGYARNDKHEKLICCCRQCRTLFHL